MAAASGNGARPASRRVPAAARGSDEHSPIAIADDNAPPADAANKDGGDASAAEDEPRRSKRPRLRRSVEPERYELQQIQDRELGKRKSPKPPLRKGENRPMADAVAGGARAASKRHKARHGRASATTATAARPLDGDGDVWRAQAAKASDASGPQSKRFARERDAVFASVPHATAWRRVQIRAAAAIPPNLLPASVLEPFAAALDRPLDAYDDAVAARCAVLRPTQIGRRDARVADDEVRATVEAALKDARPLVHQLHKTRVADVMASARMSVRACLAQLPARRLAFRTQLSGVGDGRAVETLAASALEVVATQTLLQNEPPRNDDDDAEEEDKEEGVDSPTYVVGLSESANGREHGVVPRDRAVRLPRLASISRSTACVGVRTTLPVDDDPIIRYVPFFSQASKPDTQFTQFASFQAVQKAALSALDDERDELVLRCVVRACGGDARAFHALKDLAWCLQPLADYTAVQLRETKRMLARRLQQTTVSGVDIPTTTLKQRLGGRIGEPLDVKRLDRPRATGDAADEEAALDGFRSLLCRRCYVFNCQLHGVDQPVAHARIDPVYPTVKTSLRHLVEQEETPQDAEEDAHLHAQEATPEMGGVVVAEAVDVTVMGEADAADGESVETRRAVRRSTAAVTKASTMLVTQTKKRVHSDSRRASKLDPRGEAPDYMGYDAVYHQLLAAARRAVLGSGDKDDGDGCSATCHKKTALRGSEAPPAAAAAVPAEWTPHELVLLRLAEQKVGAHACVLARFLQTKTCADVHARLTTTSEPEQQEEEADLRELRRRGRGQRAEQFTFVGGNTQEHLLRTRFQRMKDRGANHAYQPCAHSGHASCDANDCSCMRRDHFCERSCGCARDCANRFPGCRCARGECGTRECPCFFAGRECDPDVCTTCGACEVPVLALDPASGAKSSKKLRVCANTNILRGAHRRVGVAESDTHGWGAFALEEIGEGEFLYEYTGELLSQDEAERRGNVYDRNAVSFLFDLNEDAVVDAARKGNKSKFANHAAADDANCVARIMQVNGDHRIGLYAKRRIAKGDELFFDYGHHGVVPDWSQSRIRSKGAPKGFPMGAASASSVANSSTAPSSPTRNVVTTDGEEDNVATLTPVLDEPMPLATAEATEDTAMED